MRALFLMLLLYPAASAAAQNLRVATVNIWSGIDYRGVWSVGEYESEQRRGQRTAMLIDQLRREAPDVIALQEVNPAGPMSRAIAEALDLDVISQRGNAGAKIGSFGIPINLNEGLAILARRELKLRKAGVINLSETFGLFGDALSFHFSEIEIALAGRITVDGGDVHLVNVHLDASVPDMPESRRILDSLISAAGMTPRHARSVVERFESLAAHRGRQVDGLIGALADLPRRGPLIVLGDFNAERDAPEILRLKAGAGLFHAVAGDTSRPTWDPSRNGNIFLQLSPKSINGSIPTPLEQLADWYDRQSRRIDFILFDTAFRRADVHAVADFLDEASDGVTASDHFAVLAEVDLKQAQSKFPRDGDAIPAVVPPAWDVFAAPVYDTDVGFGVVGKSVLVNQLGLRESFDITLFGSTLGERWFRFGFAIPHTQIRQGREYSLALDFVLDYDKYLKNSFFGVGNRSRFEDREQYTREPLEIWAALSRGFTTELIAQAGMRYKWVRNFNMHDSGMLASLPSELNRARATAASLFAAIRYDSRDSYLHPSCGVVLSAEAEFAPSLSFTQTSFLRLGAWAQWYGTLFYPQTILAIRAGMQGLSGDDIPVQYLLPIGGNRTLRGAPQDRFLDAVTAVLNAELRFPIIWRFGGVLGYDAGKVWSRPGLVDLRAWETNPVIGLRYYFETFIVRGDVGFGRESTGLYLNFDHMF